MNSTQQINKEQYENEIVVYTPKEIGKSLKLGKNRAYELMNSKTFPSYRINNKLFVTKKDLSAVRIPLNEETESEYTVDKYTDLVNVLKNVTGSE